MEEPFVLISQLCTIFYFMYFLVIIPGFAFVEKKVALNRVWRYRKTRKRIILRRGHKIRYQV